MAKSASPVFMAGGKPTGLIDRGNIDLTTRPQVRNPDGSISTVRTISIEEDGKEILIPTVSDDGRIMSNREAIKHYQDTGRFFGSFDKPANADAYAQALHKQQEASLDMARRSSRPQEKTGIDKAADRFFRFGNDQIPGAKPQRNVVEELLGNLGRGRAGIRGDLVPPSTDFRREPQQRGATLREGMSGPQVKALQDDLVRAGLLDRKAADGRFAGATAAAVRQLEQMHGLNRDAGVAGRQVLGQLRGNAMPPPVPQSRPATVATTPRTAGTASVTPVERRDLPPPVTAAPTPNLTPIPQPFPTPQVNAPPPVQAASTPTPAPTPAPTPQVSPEWQAYIESQRTGPTYVPPSPPPPPRDFTLESEAKLNAPNPVQGNPQGLTLDQIGLPPDMALRMGEDRGMQGWPPQAPATPNPVLQDRQADARVAADKALRDAQTAPQVAPPPSAATTLPGLGNPLAGASQIGQALGGMGGLGPALQQLATQAQPAIAPPAGMTPIVDRSVFGPGYNADPLGGKEQGRLGSSYGPRGGPLSSQELPPGYVPPLPSRADIAFNAPSLSPAAPKTDRGMAPAALASLPGSGLLASQEARPSLRQAGAMSGAPTPVPIITPPPPPPSPTPQATAPPPGGASGYGRNLADVRNAIEIPTFGAQQNTPQFPAAGWGNAPSVQPSPPPPPPPPARDQNALLQGLLSMGVDAPNLPGVLSNMPGSVSFNPAEAQADAERQRDELYQQMDRADALREGGGQSSYYRDLGGGAFTGGASDNLLAGGIPTVQAPALDNIVQPQIGDQGGQGLLGGQGLGDQTQIEGPAAGRSDAQGVLDAISEISIGGNQQDQQPGGDQSATASAASGDNPFTQSQLDEQQGILAMLEEMFGSGSTR